MALSQPLQQKLFLQLDLRTSLKKHFYVNSLKTNLLCIICIHLLAVSTSTHHICPCRSTLNIWIRQLLRWIRYNDATVSNFIYIYLYWRPKIQTCIVESRQPLEEVGAAVDVDQNRFWTVSKNIITFISHLLQRGRQFVMFILVSTPGRPTNTFLYLEWEKQQNYTN